MLKNHTPTKVTIISIIINLNYFFNYKQKVRSLYYNVITNKGIKHKGTSISKLPLQLCMNDLTIVIGQSWLV